MMNTTVTNNWYEANQQYLTAALAVVREALESHANQSPDASEAGAWDGETKKSLQVNPNPSCLTNPGCLSRAKTPGVWNTDTMPAPPALKTLCEIFGLSSFERDVMLLCAGVELDASFPSLCADAQVNPRLTYPTFSLALAALPEAHWSAISPAAPLRHWRLIELGTGDGITQSPLRIDERVLHYLMGVQHLDERLVGFVESITPQLSAGHWVCSKHPVSSLRSDNRGLDVEPTTPELSEGRRVSPKHPVSSLRSDNRGLEGEPTPRLSEGRRVCSNKEPLHPSCPQDTGCVFSQTKHPVSSLCSDNRGLIDVLVPSHRALAERIAVTWSKADNATLPVVQLCGDEDASQRAIAAAACAMLDLNLHVMSAQAIPLEPRELNALMRLWEREAALSTSALLLECGELDTNDAARESAITRLIEGTNGFLIVAGRERRRTRERPLLTFDVRKPTAKEQRAIWGSALGKATSKIDQINVDMLVSQFSLNPSTIHAVCTEAFGRAAADDNNPTESDDELGSVLWDACRVQARPRLDDLAQRIDPAAAWDDLVLPETQMQFLREIAMHVRQRTKVYETWGFITKGTRGLGISALFTGPSGTGKTMAAEVLANELRLDLYRIDLSSVVSKYIGETEKNLRRVFDAAEEGGAILLFDEADALFGKRSEVKDSHDRYANIEVSYLLQRMESYRGLAILTTNMKSALDTSFLRRIRFVVQFPFPDAAQRAEIWRRIFPSDTPTEGLDVNKLARLNVSGGNIRNIALYAAFLAAEAGEPVRMTHLLRAARSEYAKLEKSLTDAEIGGWV